MTLPDDLPDLDCGIYGPNVGDPPVQEHEVWYACRVGRRNVSRLVDRPSRPTRTLTVIFGHYRDEGCILFTAFGGPLAPKETTDPSLTEEERAASVEFWSRHALVPS